MRVRVLYFGVLKDVFGRADDERELGVNSSVADLLREIEAGASTPVNLQRAIAVAVNQEYVQRSAVLQDGDEVALLPPVSGGMGKDETHAG